MLCHCCQKIRVPHSSSVIKPTLGDSAAETTDGKSTRPHECIIRHHEDFAALLKSADEGCELCQLFQPFVEHAILKKRHDVQITPSDCTDSDGSAVVLEDPFLTESELSSESWDTGSGLATNYGDDDDDADGDDGSESSNNSELDSKSLFEWYKREVFAVEKNYSILQWLLLDNAYASGPEQLWVRGHSSLSKDGVIDDFTKSKRALATISLSAGSISELGTNFEDSCFCLDGEWLDTRYALAIKAPYLWKWPCDALKIRAGRKRPLRALRPTFELFQNRGRRKSL
jgi:hypothetical protein